jgi:hypothetical protein
VVPNTTFEAAPSSPPRDLTVVPVEDNPSAINLNWQPPKQPNGQITGNDPSSSALTLLVNITATLMNQSSASSTRTGFSQHSIPLLSRNHYESHHEIHFAA